MIDILYYYYYIFYKKSKVETQPHLTTVWVLSFCLTWIIIVPIDMFFTYVFRANIVNKWIYLGLFCVIFFILYWYFIRKKRGIKIIEKKPILLGSKTLSIIFVIIFTILPLILMYLGATWDRIILNSP